MCSATHHIVGFQIGCEIHRSCSRCPLTARTGRGSMRWCDNGVMRHVCVVMQLLESPVKHSNGFSWWGLGSARAICCVIDKAWPECGESHHTGRMAHILLPMAGTHCPCAQVTIHCSVQSAVLKDSDSFLPWPPVLCPGCKSALML